MKVILEFALDYQPLLTEVIRESDIMIVIIQSTYNLQIVMPF